MAERLLHPIRMYQSIAFDNSSSSDEEHDIPKITNYAEDIIPRMSDSTFKTHFRMSKASFEILINQAGNISNRNPVLHVGAPKMIFEKEFMITIWYLANLESFRSVSERFGIAKSTCWEVLYRTCHALININKHFEIIKWPDEEKQLQISQGFATENFLGNLCYRMYRWKSHTDQTTKRNGNSYVNRKGYHSMLLQGICDNKMLFTDIYAGEAGSLHDYTLYKRSEFYKDMQNGKVNFFRGSYLLGDLAYKLSTSLIVGFKDNGYLNHRQKLFNQKLSQIRVKIENAFGLLKSCILHNICILNNEELEALNYHQQNETDISSYEEEDDMDEEEENPEHDSRNMANLKRNEIMESFQEH
ncbi:uncharacterized protein [Prorops nasuta]|uniref:uncharacterized protein n=1 Tax=Prorops nasuta TaxID=863751 RepID=UPI0034CEFEC8